MVVNMTKAKRYEGEALRAEQWHNMGRDRAWERKAAGLPELQRIVAGKFNVWCEVQYDKEDCGYLIVTEIGPGGPMGPMGHLAPLSVLMRHEEPSIEFPSDHLKTKLLLLAG